MKKKLISLFVAWLALSFLVSCGYETPRTRELRAEADLTGAEAARARAEGEAESRRVQAEGEAYAIKRQADAEAYTIRKGADEEMAVTQQWIAERMAILRNEQRDSLLIRALIGVSAVASLTLPAQLGLMVWMYLSQKSQSARDTADDERKFYALIIAMQRGRLDDWK